jgi:hypothetical protein
MPDIIDDGKGKGNKAAVDGNNRLHVGAVNTAETIQANKDGDAYNINTGVITLTDAADTPVLYLKNNETKDLYVSAMAIGLDTATGGTATEMVKITIVRNPTAGTIVDNATNVAINSNRNYGSSNSLTVDAYKGATGNTMTNGEDHILFFQADFGRLFATIDEVIPKGSSIGVKIDPPANTTSFPIYAALICNLLDSENNN